MKNPWLQVLIALAVGIVVGWTADARLSSHRPHWASGKMLEHFSRELSLDAAQKEKVGKILEAKRGRFAALREEMKPRFDEIKNSMKQEISAVLTSEQNLKFEKIQAEWEARRKEKRERKGL